MKLDIVKGNIVAVAADAIVLPAKTTLKEGAGASRAIFIAAGRDELTKACKNIGFCKVGEAVPTPAYQLNANCIVHAVVPKWVNGESGELELLSTAYQSALKVADMMEGCKSVAFPLLASGNNGFDAKIAFEIAVESIKSYEKTYEVKNLQRVLLVVYSDSIASIVASQGYLFSEFPIKSVTTGKTAQEINRGKTELEVIAREYWEGVCNRVLTYLGDPENRERFLDVGEKAVKAVVAVAVAKAMH